MFDSELFDEYRKKYPLLITVGEAAEISRRPEQTIYDWSSRGLLDRFKVKRGRRLLLRLRDFLDFLGGE